MHARISSKIFLFLLSIKQIYSFIFIYLFFFWKTDKLIFFITMMKSLGIRRKNNFSSTLIDSLANHSYYDTLYWDLRPINHIRYLQM